MRGIVGIVCMAVIAAVGVGQTRIAMNSRVRALVFGLLLAAAGLGAGCTGSTDVVDLGKFWDKMQRESGS